MRLDTAIKILKNNTNDELFEILRQKHIKLTDTFSSITYHESKCLTLIKHAITNVIKLDENKRNKVDNSFYYDFFQVRDLNKNLMFTYCLDKYDGIAYRGIYMKSSSSLDLDKLKDFLKNKDAISAFNKIVGYPKIIDDLIIVMSKINNKSSDTVALNKVLLLKFTKKEKELLPELDRIEYHIKENRFYRADKTGYNLSTYDNDSLQIVAFKYIVASHSKYIIRNIDKTYDAVFKMSQVYTTEIEEINSILSKYIMLDKI